MWTHTQRQGMKRVRFRDPSGSVRTGAWLAGDGTPAETDSAGTEGVIEFGGSRYDPSEVTVLPPCEPTKLVCVGRNYVAHAEEMGGDVPDRPLLFLKPPNTVASHGTEVTLPAGKQRLDYEGELGVVIGEQCRHVSESEAMDVVAGFTCVVDLSNRDDQTREQNWVRGKAFDGAAPLGPVLSTPEHVPSNPTIELRVDGELEQTSKNQRPVFDVPELVAEITTYMTLEPGDVIATGTPDGVGPLSDGNEVTVRIEGVGVLRHSVSIPE
jgi:2-keto-4-pentenoate hydratase/2-oxohepta-3-ene-1,7-dioic acid hydratase in catechol pathway